MAAQAAANTSAPSPSGMRSSRPVSVASTSPRRISSATRSATSPTVASPMATSPLVVSTKVPVIRPRVRSKSSRFQGPRETTSAPSEVPGSGRLRSSARPPGSGSEQQDRNEVRQRVPAQALEQLAAHGQSLVGDHRVGRTVARTLHGLASAVHEGRLEALALRATRPVPCARPGPVRTRTDSTRCRSGRRSPAVNERGGRGTRRGERGSKCARQKATAPPLEAPRTLAAQPQCGA